MASVPAPPPPTSGRARPSYPATFPAPVRVGERAHLVARSSLRGLIGTSPWNSTRLNSQRLSSPSRSRLRMSSSRIVVGPWRKRCSARWTRPCTVRSCSAYFASSATRKPSRSATVGTPRRRPLRAGKAWIRALPMKGCLRRMSITALASPGPYARRRTRRLRRQRADRSPDASMPQPRRSPQPVVYACSVRYSAVIAGTFHPL